MILSIKYAIVSSSLFGATVFAPLLLSLIGLLLFFIIRGILMCLARRLVYDSGQTETMPLKKPEMKPIYATRMIMRQKPVYKERPAKKKEPIHKTRIAYKQRPVYKQVQKTRPKYKTVNETRSVWKDTSRTETYYDTEYYYETEFYYQQVAYQKEHISYTYSSNGNNYFTTEYRSEPASRQVYKSRQVPRTRVIPDGQYVTETVATRVEDGTEEYTDTVQDGYENVPYEESYIAGYKDVSFAEKYIAEYTEEPYEERYIARHEPTGNMVTEYCKYHKTYGVAHILAQHLTSYRSVFLSLFSGLGMIILQAGFLASQIYFGVIVLRHRADLEAWMISIPILSFFNIVVAIVTMIFMVRCTCGIESTGARTVQLILKKVWSHKTWIFCCGEKIVVHELKWGTGREEAWGS